MKLRKDKIREAYVDRCSQELLLKTLWQLHRICLYLTLILVKFTKYGMLDSFLGNFPNF